MIAINDVVINDSLPKDHEYYEFSKAMKDEWGKLNNKYDLEKGGSLLVKLKDKYRVKKIISSENGETSTATLSFPAGVSISYKTTINYKGQEYTVRYFNTRTKDKNGDFAYNETAQILRGNKTLTGMDKDLILYLFLFSAMVSTSPEKKFYEVKKNNFSGRLHFYDELGDAITENEVRTKTAIAIAAVDKTNADLLRRFATHIGILVDDNVRREIVVNKIIKSIDNTIRDRRGTAVLLQEFLDNLDKYSAEVQGVVEGAIKNGKIKCFHEKINGDWETSWNLMNGDKKGKELLSYKGNSEATKHIVTYLTDNIDTYKKIEDTLS